MRPNFGGGRGILALLGEGSLFFFGRGGSLIFANGVNFTFLYHHPLHSYGPYPFLLKALHYFQNLLRSVSFLNLAGFFFEKVR